MAHSPPQLPSQPLQYSPAPVTTPKGRPLRPYTWAYGITTVPERRDDLLPQTLASLHKAGFNRPHLFVDRCTPEQAAWYSHTFKLPVSNRIPGPNGEPARCYGNWALGLWELYVRNPQAHRYAMFQDDVVLLPDTRSYLETIPYPGPGDGWYQPGQKINGPLPGYINLYTACSNHPQTSQRRPLPAPPGKGYNGGRVGWYESNQLGKGAIALVFSRAAVFTLLTSTNFVQKPMAATNAWQNMDGCIGDSFKFAGWLEYIHWPSLAEHTGNGRTTMGAGHYQTQPGAPSFPGETVSALDFLDKSRFGG